jgi:ResB-like family
MASPTATADLDRDARPRTEGFGQLVRKALKPLASLRLTVALFGLSIVLVFCGTLAQIDNGIWSVVNEYFRWWYVWIPFQVFVRFGQVFFFLPQTLTVPASWGFPFPGGWTLGTLLLANLIAAHAVRFKFTWKRAGILLIHAGLIVLMLGELITGVFQVEARMVIAAREAVNFTDETHAVELAVTDPSGDEVTVVPGSRLKAGAVVRNDLLPFDVQVAEYDKNSNLVALDKGEADTPDTFTSTRGVRFKLVQQAEGAGVGEQHDDVPMGRFTFRKKGSDEDLGTRTLSLWFNPNVTQRLPVYQFAPQQVALDGKNYTVELRYRRAYKPYTIQLIEFRHDLYVGTKTPKNFSSRVRLIDPDRGEDREVLIRMNEPLRYQGETFYQSAFLPGDTGTVLQVVRNPGVWMPYASCLLVSLGMVVHFGLNLITFLEKRAAS